MTDGATRETAPRLITPGFVALAAAALAFFVAGGLVLPIAPRFAKFALEADSIGVGVALGSFSVAALLLRPFVGWSADRFGRKPLLIGGSLITVGALALHLVANDIVVFIAARSLLGAGEGFFFVAALAAAADIAPEARRGEAITAEVMKKIQWLRPKLVAQIEFTEWTEGNHLRHSQFVALRSDKRAQWGRETTGDVRVCHDWLRAESRSAERRGCPNQSDNGNSGSRS